MFYGEMFFFSGRRGTAVSGNGLPSWSPEMLSSTKRADISSATLETLDGAEKRPRTPTPDGSHTEPIAPPRHKHLKLREAQEDRSGLCPPDVIQQTPIYARSISVQFADLALDVPMAMGPKENQRHVEFKEPDTEGESHS